MDGLKVGILTFHRCINYGSYWQARCLVEGLQDRGYNTTIIDHHSGRVNMAEWKCAYRPVLPTPVPESDYPLYRKKIEGFFKAFASLPMSRPFPLENPSAMEDYDVIVVGSDEVWNLFHPWYGNNPLFYGEGLAAERLISYAACFGNYPATWGLNHEWAEKLRNFEMISVRDENSWYIVKNAIDVEPEIVLDPTLQFPVVPDQRGSTYFQKPYVAVYGHNFSPFFIKNIRKWASSQNLPLVSIGYRNDWTDKQWIAADPHDFAHFMAYAEAVATNFFHGCAFALRNEKPFACEVTPYRSNKVHGLMVAVGGEQHMVSEETPAEAYNVLLSKPLNQGITRRIEHLRQTSGAWLDVAMGIQQIKYA